jgi:hypothetical protein
VYRLRFVIVAVLVFAMIPASGEIIEHTVHLVMAGHTAHAIPDETHQPEAPEHGCSGPIHVCACHASTPLTAPGVTAVPGAPALRESEVAPRADSDPFDGYLHGVFRPPIA